MKPEDIQHGGNHYKDQPKHLQPSYLATALKLNPMEYSVLKYLLRHRKKGGLLDLQKMIHFGQMLLQEEYGVETEIKYLSEPIDAEFEVVPESQSVTSDNLQESLVCPWRFGDVIHHRAKPSDFDWTVTEVTSKGVECRAGDRGEVSMFVPVAFYGNYRLCDQIKSDESSVCPFKVGDVIHHREDVRGRSEIRWRVTGFTANSVQVVSDDVYRSPSHIERQVWHRYVKVEQPAAERRELPACPFRVGDVIRGIGEPESSKWKVERVRSDRIDVITYDVHKHPAYVEYSKWQNYIKVDAINGTPVDKPEQTC